MERQNFEKRGPMVVCSHCTYRGARREAIQHFLNEHLEKDVVPFMCGLCKTRHPSQSKLEEHKRTAKHLQALKGVPALEEMVKGNPSLFDLISKNPHPLNIMDASHPGSERADLKILSGEDSRRLWQERAEKKSRPSKRKSVEPQLQFGLDESFQESPFISKKSRMTASHSSSPTPSVSSSPEIPPPPTPHYSPSPVCARTAPSSHTSSTCSHSSRRRPSPSPRPSFTAPPSITRITAPPASSPAAPSSTDDTLRTLSGQLSIMNSHLATVSSKLTKAVEILAHDQGKVLKELQAMNHLLVNMDRRAQRQEKNGTSYSRKILGVLQDFHNTTTTMSAKMESTVTLAGSTYQGLTSTLKNQERAVQDLLDHSRRAEEPYIPRRLEPRPRPAYRPTYSHRK